MVYPYITQTKLQVRLSFLEEKHKRKWNEGNEKVYSSEGEWLRKEKAVKDAIRRAKVAVVDYALNNDFEYFGTFTFDDRLVNIHTADGQAEALDQVLRFLDNYRQNVSSDFRYIIAPEYGSKTKRLHFHFLIKGIKEDELFINEHKKLDWVPYRCRFGFVQIAKIGASDNDKRNVAFYCSKYITKDNIQIRSHRYFCSRDLKKPTRFCMDDYFYTCSMKEWLEKNGFLAYFQSDLKNCSCFSVPARVFFDMLRELGIFCDEKSGCVLFEGFEACYAENPFERREMPFVPVSVPVAEQLSVGGVL